MKGPEGQYLGLCLPSGAERSSCIGFGSSNEYLKAAGFPSRRDQGERSSVKIGECFHSLCVVQLCCLLLLGK